MVIRNKNFSSDIEIIVKNVLGSLIEEHFTLVINQLAIILNYLHVKCLLTISFQ